MPPTTRKQPTDRLAKQETRAAGDVFVVAIGDAEFTSRPLSEVFTPKWLRLNRRREDVDAGYTMIEDAFDGVPGFLDAWDELTFDEQAEQIGALQKSMETTLGESMRSST